MTIRFVVASVNIIVVCLYLIRKTSLIAEKPR